MPQDFSYMYPAFPIVGSLAVFTCMLSVPAHMKVGNIAVVSLAFWIGIGILMLVIGSCVWHGNIRNPYPIWGDIVQQYFTMMPIALATCTLCIQYRLWSVVRAKTVFITKRERKVRIYTTCFLCFGIPVIVGVIHYVSQGHRYNVWEDLGPFLETYNTPVALATYSIWEPLFIFIAGIYAIHTLFLFFAHQKEVDVALNSGSININKKRYVRLMGLATIALVFHLPLSLWIFISNCVIYPVSPWISWQDTHSNYGRIMYSTRLIISLNPKNVILMSLNWWALVFSGFTFFIFFGLGEEATKQYRFWVRMCLRPLGVDYPKENSRETVKRTWLDVLLRRPGRPVLSKSGPDHVIRHQEHSFDPAATRSSDYANASHQSSNVGNVAANPTNPDILDPTRVDSEHSTMPLPTMRQTATDAHPSHVSLVQSDVLDPTESDVADEKLEDDGQHPPLTSMEMKVVGDLEAQESPELSVEEQRRKEILEKNPELTEKVFF